jgi:hypothetical protein
MQMIKALKVTSLRTRTMKILDLKQQIHLQKMERHMQYHAQTRALEREPMALRRRIRARVDLERLKPAAAHPVPQAGARATSQEAPKAA